MAFLMLPCLARSCVNEAPPSGRVYRLRADGRVDCLLQNVPGQNGLVLSPDEKALFLAVTRATAIMNQNSRRFSYGSAAAFYADKLDASQHRPSLRRAMGIERGGRLRLDVANGERVCPKVVSILAEWEIAPINALR
jgi:hypothetical protein